MTKRRAEQGSVQAIDLLSRFDDLSRTAFDFGKFIQAQTV
jgi:hypothetical protein